LILEYRNWRFFNNSKKLPNTGTNYKPTSSQYICFGYTWQPNIDRTWHLMNYDVKGALWIDYCCNELVSMSWSWGLRSIQYLIR
jgi:hypothetical protein